MRDRGARGVERCRDIQRIHALPGPWITVSDRLEGKAASDIDQRIQFAEMRGGRVDCFFGLRGVGEVDATEFEALRRWCRVRGGVIASRHAGASRQRGLHDDLAKRARRAGYDDYLFLQHDGPGRNVRRASTMAARS